MSQSRKLIITVVLISLITGGLAGAILGFYSDKIAAGPIEKFLEKILIGKGTIPERGLSPTREDKEKKIIQEIVKIEEEATISVVEKVSPSVVSIIVSQDLSKYSHSGPEFSPFEEFKEFFDYDWPFKRKFFKPQAPEGKQEIGGGSGFIISTDGLILTNKHVISEEEADYTVITNDGQRWEAEVLARDPFMDIGILKIEAENLVEVELGDSSQFQIGQTVIAIGNALGEYRNTVTRGVISGIGRRVVAQSGWGRSEVLEDVIQTDAAINLGNSGGPLLNLSGEVIGINTAMSSKGQLIGFAIPINAAKQAIESVKKYGKIIRPFLGVRYVLINQKIAKENHLSVDHGALVVRGTKPTELAIIPGSPADKAGIVENDIILEVNGQKINKKNSLAKMITKYSPGDEITLKILHKGEEKSIKVTLGEFEG